MTIREALRLGAARLRAQGIASPFLDASLLLGALLRLDRAGLYLADLQELSGAVEASFRQSLQRRLAGEAAAYILGYREFRNLNFLVTEAVLIPRPDTETLVEAALQYLRSFQELGAPAPKVLDLGAGSGAVAVSLKHECPEASLYASDISPQALRLARENARRLLGSAPEHPDGGICFGESDLFAGLGRPGSGGFSGPFHLIVSNPPYVPTGIIASLDPAIRREPRLALDGGGDGLDLIRRIIAQGPDQLVSGGVLLLEADPRQMPAIAVLLRDRGYGDLQTYQDLSQQERVIGGRYPPRRMG
ncbi:MAG: peptide chain release factor N(5)-glutamine methyltransferase [Treponema sp.]|jgi:release factor glutamine methyltransferase|nr:peptide chain release factor N(5)-glutamine methyltransferase [Treponema sp.]